MVTGATWLIATTLAWTQRGKHWIAALCGALVEIGREMAKEGGLPPAHFIAALKATQSSLDTRREMAGHPRGYLDFLAEFMSEARGES